MEREMNGDVNKNIFIELSSFKKLKEYNRDYEEKIIQFIKLFKDCWELEEILQKSIENREYSPEVNYAAFFALCTIYRRNKNFSRYNFLVSNSAYVKRFEKYISFGHLKSMCLIELVKTKGDVVKAIEYSKNVIEKAEALIIGQEEKKQLNIGFYHSYSVNVMKGFEEGYLNSPNDDEYFVLAKEYVKKSIDQNCTYAKFHCTLGRLHMIEKQYEQAIEEFKTAIDYEESSNSDYALRINDYQHYMSSAKAYRNMEKLNTTILEEARKELENTTARNTQNLAKVTADVKKELEDIRARNIEVLSFFVAIMSFIIGSIQLANSSDKFMDKAALIILLFGCLLVVLGAFGKNLTGNIKNNYTFSIFVGLSMIVCGILLKLFFGI